MPGKKGREVLEDLQRAYRADRINELLEQLVGSRCFTAGMYYGIGADLIDQVRGLAELLKTLVLAEAYDHSHGRRRWVEPFAPPPLALEAGFFAWLEFSHRNTLIAAAKERDDLIESLRYAFSHPKEMLQNIEQTYLDEWHAFQKHAADPGWRSQFQAGRIFGEMLLGVLSLFAAGAGLVKLAAQVPRMASLAGRLGRIAEGLPKDVPGRLRQRRARARAREEESTPIIVRMRRAREETAARLARQPVEQARVSRKAETPPLERKADGLHNQPYKVDVPRGSFKPVRKVDMKNLSAEDQAANETLKEQQWPERDRKQILESGDSFKVKELKQGDKLYGFTTQGVAKKANSSYWLDEGGYKDVKGRYYKDGTWDKEGVKNYLALPCYNRADSIDMAEVTRPTSVLEAKIGTATELIQYSEGSGGYSTGLMGKIMPGGGNQVTPSTSAIQLLGK